MLKCVLFRGYLLYIWSLYICYLRNGSIAHIWLQWLIVKAGKYYYICLNWKTSLNLTLFHGDGKSHTVKCVLCFKYVKDMLSVCAIHTVIYIWEMRIYLYCTCDWIFKNLFSFKSSTWHKWNGYHLRGNRGLEWFEDFAISHSCEK